jgi:acyl carrier protein
VARVLGLSRDVLSNLDTTHSLNKLGIDSLMGVELKNRIEIDLGVDIPVMRLLRGFTIADLTSLVLAQLMGEEPDSPIQGAGPDQAAVEREDSLLISLSRLLAGGEHQA